jgi:predicted NBD/HSP70 family sugar kinase
VIPATPALGRHQRTPAQLLETIRELGGATRADLSRLTGLSRSAVAHAVAVLLAEGLITEAGRILGRTLADLCNCLNPEAVILGGEIGLAGAPLVAGVRESIDRYAQPAAAEAVRVLTAGLGDRSELMGALAHAAGQVAGPR